MHKKIVELFAFVPRVLLVRMEILVLLDLLVPPYVSQYCQVSFILGRMINSLNWILRFLFRDLQERRESKDLLDLLDSR